MKKMLLLCLCMAMVLMLGACGGGDAASTTAATEPPVAETTLPEETVPETTVPETTLPETEPQAAFDTAWAANEFEQLIPQPPFAGWTGEQVSDNVYEMETPEADAEGVPEYYETFEAYALSLKDLGFEVEGEINEFTAKDSAGNVIKLLCGDGYAWITITKAEN